jgi:hypothetical protein
MDYPAFTELRVRTRLNGAQLERLKGNFVQRDGIDVMLTGPTEVRLPSGELLAKYLPGALSDVFADDVRDILFLASQGTTDNRGRASGYERKKNKAKASRTRTPHVRSSILGSFDRSPAHQMRCRLTAWSGTEIDKWQALFPMFQQINGYFKAHVPDRYAAQERFSERTHPDWLIAGTVFSTVTVNRSYPTGVHTDAGDLDEGFSTLAVLRKGNYSGGIFTFPEYRIGVNMQHGDLLLMDAHQWHGNTPMTCGVCGQGMGAVDLYPDHTACGVERISVVSYYRTKMAECGSMQEEYAGGVAFTDRNVLAAHERLLAEMEAEAQGAV